MKGKLEITHQKIMDSAIALIRQNSFENVSIDAICEECEISRSTFYNHFRSKEHLISEYFDELKIITPSRVMWAYDAPTAYERALRIQLAYLLRMDLDEEERNRLCNMHLKKMLISPSSENLEVVSCTQEFMIPLVRQAQESGEILNSASPEELCNAAYMLKWGSMFMRSVSDSSFDLIDHYIQSLEILFNVRQDLRGLNKVYSHQYSRKTVK